MKQDRRSFIRNAGIGLAISGIVPAFLQACKTPQGKTIEVNDLTAGVESLSDLDYAARQAKVQRLMQESGVDALWIEGGINLQYFFDVSWWMSERVFGVVLPANGNPVWISPAFEGPRASDLIRFGDDLRTWQDHESPYRLLDQIFKSQPAPLRILAIDPNVRSFVIQGIRRESNVEIMDGSALINGCRGIKSDKEIAYLDLANNITKKAFKWAFSQVKPGMMPEEFRQLVSTGHSQLGVTGGGWPLFGALSAFPHGSREQYELKDGDVILLDGGCSVEGYKSDVTRTIICGTPGDKQKRVFDIVRNAQLASHAAVRPGLPAGELDRIARKVIEDAGYGPQYSYFVHRLGHGIGMEGHEWPYLVKDNPLPLKPGMCFSNEPGIYIYGEFGIRIEDCFVVNEDGGKFLGGMLCNSLDDAFGH